MVIIAFFLVIIYIYLYLFQPNNEMKIKLNVVTHAYNFAYSGGRGRDLSKFEAFQGYITQNPVSKKKVKRTT